MYAHSSGIFTYKAKAKQVFTRKAANKYKTQFIIFLSFYFTNINHFVLVHHQKSPQNAKTFVIKWEKFRGYEYLYSFMHHSAHSFHFYQDSNYAHFLSSLSASLQIAWFNLVFSLFIRPFFCCD